MVVSGYIISKLAQMVLLRDIKLELLPNVSHGNMALTMRRLLLNCQSLLCLHFFVIEASRQWKLFQMDVKNIFLNDDLSKEVYI